MGSGCSSIREVVETRTTALSLSCSGGGAPSTKSKILKSALAGRPEQLQSLLKQCIESPSDGPRVAQSVIPTAMVRASGCDKGTDVRIAAVVKILLDTWTELSKSIGVMHAHSWDTCTCLALCLAGSRNYARVAETLLSHECGAASADVRNSLYETPLIITAEYGHSEAMKILLEHGARAELMTLDGKTPGQIAASWRHLQCVEILVQAGCSITHTSHDLLSMKEYAQECSQVADAIRSGQDYAVAHHASAHNTLATADQCLEVPLVIVTCICDFAYGVVSKIDLVPRRRPERSVSSRLGSRSTAR